MASAAHRCLRRAGRILDPSRGGSVRLMLAGIVGTTEHLVATPYTVV
jgi:hypothetical protein